MKFILPSKVAILKQLKQHRKNIVSVHNNHMKKLDETIQHLEKEIDKSVDKVDKEDKTEDNKNLMNTIEYSLDDEV